MIYLLRETFCGLYWVGLCMILSIGCTSNTAQDKSTKKDLLLPDPNNKMVMNNQGSTIQERFNPPSGYNRNPLATDSYAEYLRHLPLKENGSPVLHYDGTRKYNQSASAAVVDLKIGDKNLHQCADAVMRLRAEYLWSNKLYDQIHFNLTNGMEVGYNRWLAGDRIAVNGNKTSWVHKHDSSNTSEGFWNYLELIFMYAGTLSLSKELEPVKVQDMKIGDVFILGGSPGHAIVVVDMAEDKNGSRVFMLAQSYMPAQELHVLVNPSNASTSPWYDLDFGSDLTTPEWNFKSNQLRRFSEE